MVKFKVGKKWMMDVYIIIEIIYYFICLVRMRYEVMLFFIVFSFAVIEVMGYLRR